MKTMRLALLTTLCLAALAVPASAATNFGRTFAPGVSDLPEAPNFVVSASDNSQSAPVAGIITSFSHVGENAPVEWIKLMMVRRAGDSIQIVGLSDPQTTASSVLGIWPTRIPVEAGDLIGLVGPTAELAAATSTSNYDEVFYGIPASSVSLGQTFTYLAGNEYDGYKLDIAATIEADADGDGFGDETQDLCPSDATTQGACDTTGPVLKLKTKKIKRGASTVSITVSTNEAATLKLTGSFKAGKKKYKVKSATKILTVGKTTTTKVSLPKKAKAKLKAGKTLKGSLSITATDAKGNLSTYTSKPTVRPKKK